MVPERGSHEWLLDELSSLAVLATHLRELATLHGELAHRFRSHPNYYPIMTLIEQEQTNTKNAFERKLGNLMNGAIISAHREE